MLLLGAPPPSRPRHPCLMPPRHDHAQVGEHQSQPIAIRDVMHYLVANLNTPETAGLTLDIGLDVLRYEQLMRIMAEELDSPPSHHLLSRPYSPRNSQASGSGLVTPVSPRIARPLAEGLRDRRALPNRASELMPRPDGEGPCSVRESILVRLWAGSAGGEVETSWTEAGGDSHGATPDDAPTPTAYAAPSPATPTGPANCSSCTYECRDRRHARSRLRCRSSASGRQRVLRRRRLGAYGDGWTGSSEARYSAADAETPPGCTTASRSTS